MDEPENPEVGRRLEIGAWTLDPGLDRLERGEESVALEPRATDLLLCLARHAGQTVSKETILEEVWSGAAVVEGVIPKTISTLRAALGDDASSPTYILTVPRRGYRLIARVLLLETASQPIPDPNLVTSTWPRPRWGLVVIAVGLTLAAAYVAVRQARSNATDPAGLRPAAPPPTATRELPASLETLVLEARHLWAKRSVESVRRANELFLDAVREAPHSAEIHGWLALSFVTRGTYLGSLEADLEPAGRHAEQALALDPDSAIGHCATGVLGVIRDRQPGVAIRHLRRALELDPDLLPARQFLAEALTITGQHEEALAEIDQAISVDPLSAMLHGVRGLILLRAQRLLAALEAFDRVLVLEPAFTWMHRDRAWVLARLGRTQEAGEALYRRAQGVGEQADSLAELRRALESEGLEGYWSWRMGRLELVRARGVALRPAEYAEALAGVGRAEEALAELRRAADTRDGELFFLIRDSPAFDALRSNPEFLAIYAPFEQDSAAAGD